MKKRKILVLEYDRSDGITTCLAHRNDKNGIGDTFAYTYVMPSDFRSRHDIIWTNWQIKKLKANYKKHNRLNNLNNILNKTSDVNVNW